MFSGSSIAPIFAFLHAEAHEAAREAVHLLAELVPGEPEVAVGVDDGVVHAAARNSLVEQLPERVFARDGHVVPRRAHGYTLRERTFDRCGSRGIAQFKLFHARIIPFLRMFPPPLSHYDA